VGIAVRRAAVVGEGKQAARIFEHLSAHPEFGLSMIGEVCERPPVSVEVKRLGAVSEVRRVIQEHHIDTLIIAPEQDGPDPLPALIKACYGINVDFLYLPDIMPASGRPRRVVKVGGVPLWTLKEAPFTGWPGVGKRAFDCVIGSLMFLGALPVLILTAFAIKLDSRGPLIYKQRRVGLDGREFDCLKFRSMRVDAEAQTGAVWAVKDDPRVSRVGKFIRRWSVDELPQLWNVLRGDMSLVGPRPERPEFVRQFEQRIDGYHERHRVRSGLTGWAQINGLRGDTPIEDRTVYDRYYVENWSLFFDLKILFLTFAAILRGENSY
jgi:exopolysaccharide biosynthesis polyprenyl glycosylphosphotransferase